MSSNEDRDPYVGIIRGAAGWFAVLWVWTKNDNKFGGFYEPEATGAGYHDTPQSAAEEALVWAQLDNLRCAFYGPVQEYDTSYSELQEGESDE